MNSNLKFQTVKISDIGKIITGKTPSTKVKEYFGGNFPFIKPTDIEIGSRFVQKSEVSLSEKGGETMKNSILPSFTTCVVTIGSIGKKICLTNKPSFTNQQINSIIPYTDKYDSLFVFYLLKNNLHLVEQIESGSASGRQNVNKSTFSGIKVKVPEFEIQKIMGSILGEYDNLIENKIKTIEILKKILQLIFNEWFVRFNFPQSKKLTLVTSDIGDIPSDWNLTTLDEIIVSISSGSRPKGGVKGILDGIPSIGAENIDGLGNYDYSKEKFVPKEFFQKMKNGIICNNDVLLYKDGAHVGRKSFFKKEYPHKDCCINEHVFILRTQENLHQNFLYFWLDQDWMTENIVNLNSNTAQPGINMPGVKSLPILLPPTDLIVEYNKIVNPLMDMLFLTAKQIRNLTQTRDILLPSLLNGEIDISKLQIKNLEKKHE